MRSKITLAQHGALFELEDLTMNKEVNKSGEGQ